MSYVRYVTSQGIIESSPGRVKILPRRTSRRANKNPLYLYGTALHALHAVQHHLQHFVLDMAPVCYDRFVLEPVRSDETTTGVSGQCLCVQHLPDYQFAFGYAEDPERDGWGYRNRICLGAGTILRNLVPAIAHAVRTNPTKPTGADYRWAIKGYDASEREFRISDRQLMINSDKERSSALKLERFRDAFWRSLSALALELINDRSTTCCREMGLDAGRRVNVTKMQHDLMRLEYPDADGNMVILQLDGDMLEALSVLPALHWGEVGISGQVIYLIDDEDEFDDE